MTQASPPPNPGFAGTIGRTLEDSKPAWVEPRAAPPGSPNIVVIYMDDMGYSDIGCFGSEIATPHIDSIAQRGLRLNHYTTHPICSPARAALLTGRNAHSVSTGWLANNDAGFPGYSEDQRGQARIIFLNQNQALGHSRFYARIEAMTWHRREAKLRGRPSAQDKTVMTRKAGQDELEI